MEKKTKELTYDVTIPLSFDGFGINGLNEYRDRIATFTRRDKNPEIAEHFGPLFAAAPKLLATLKNIAKWEKYATSSVQGQIIADAKRAILEVEPNWKTEA